MAVLCMTHKMLPRLYRDQLLRANSYSFMVCFFGCCFFLLVFVFGFCLCVCSFCGFWFRLLFCVLLMRPGNAHWTMYRSAIASFLVARLLVIYQLVSAKYKLVERPGGSHEGVGRKKQSHKTLRLRREINFLLTFIRPFPDNLQSCPYK